MLLHRIALYLTLLPATSSRPRIAARHIEPKVALKTQNMRDAACD